MTPPSERPSQPPTSPPSASRSGAAAPSHRSGGAAGDAVNVLLVVLVTALTRLPYIPGGVVGKDGPMYFNALKLDRTFNVPPPGNIGYVVLGKVSTLVFSSEVVAFAAVGILLSCIGAAYLYLLASLALSRGAAVLVALAVMLSPLTWYHGTPVMSYIVWLSAPPVIAYYGVRFMRERRPALLLAAATATGLSTILRPDMVAFAGPLLAGVLVLGAARPRLWAASAAICAACCAVWFFGTAAVLGGVDVFLDSVRSKHEFHEGFGAGSKGAFEGLGRNGAKYGLLLFWTAHAALPLAALGMLRDAAALRSTWRWWVLAALWVGPSLYFALWIFMGNAGLILPALPLVYFAAARGLQWVARPPVAMAGLAGLVLLSAAQFVLTPIPRPSDQRAVILTVIFFKYSGAGIRSLYNYNLTDFDIDPSLGNTLRQMRNPEPVPTIPEGLPGAGS